MSSGIDTPPTVFLLSPASLVGKRAAILLRAEASFPLAQALRTTEGAALADVFSFLSGLYFRGKATYARAFGSALVITSSAGLVDLGARVTASRLRALAGVPIDASERRYREPLLRDAHALAARIGPACPVVLLGSIATDKYVEPLHGVFGDRLLFPTEFVGRGDMSRGGLLLRAADARRELAYAPIVGAVRHGTRPPRLAPRRSPR